MDIKTIDHLCELSKLNYSDDEKQQVMREMGAIIELMDTVKQIDLTYDDTKDFNSIAFSQLRRDEAAPSFSSEKLLSNTDPEDGCYVVPKMVE